MKTKMRKTIGKVLIWGGLGILAVTTYYLNSINTLTMSIVVSEYINKIFLWNLGAIIALLIGGLWGMKK